MQLALYTSETSNWYKLLNKAQAASGFYLAAEVERYIVYVMTSMANDSIYSLESDETMPKTKRDQRLHKMRKTGEQCLIVAGLFPDHANRTGVPLMYMMEKGRKAYNDLAEAVPEMDIYSFLGENFLKVIDLLQRLGEYCGVNHTLDLIQACELWQETGSRHSWSVIQNHTGAFPSATASDLQH